MLSKGSLVDTNENTINLSVRRGCLHEGLLSPLLWSLVVEDLNHSLNEQGI